MNEHSIRFLDENIVLKAQKFGRLAKLSPIPLRRQMLTAHRILKDLFCRRGRKVPGILLADDVGLGKTTVAAIVAWVAASAGNGMAVRILTPNPTIRQRWDEELRRVLPALNELAPHLKADERQIRAAAKNLHKGHIHLSTHIRAVKHKQVSGNLIIVDEAHRSKHSSSEFRKRLKAAGQDNSTLLFLTATPMSIELREMAELLEVLGGVDVKNAVLSFGEKIANLYDPKVLLTDDELKKELIEAADLATKQMSSCVVRHSIGDLSTLEQKAFGKGRVKWAIEVPSATPEEIALLARADRLLRMAHPRKRSNDPQFHVARIPIRKALDRARRVLDQRGLYSLAAPHFAAIEGTKLLARAHPKIKAVAEAVARRAKDGEKVVVFCHHHLVAAELTRELARKLPSYPSFGIERTLWREVWEGVISSTTLKHPPHKDLDGIRRSFVEWICAQPFRNQIGSWLGSEVPASHIQLRTRLKATKAPRGTIGGYVTQEIQALFRNVADAESRSTVSIFRGLARNKWPLDSIPFGSDVASRVLGACDAESVDDRHLFLREARPDLLMALFNSPFGPDVVVVTDKYSEGIDLHKACRLLIHYELDPSPMRTIQREGRVRRVGGYAGKARLPVEYAMPAFGGTRDERVVSIMSERIRVFGLLLGGVPVLKEEDIADGIDARVKRVLQAADGKLQVFNRRLRIKSLKA